MLALAVAWLLGCGESTNAANDERAPTGQAGTTGGSQAGAAGQGGTGGDTAGAAGHAGASYPVTCFDGAKDGAETDVDCGGPCAGCHQQQACNGPADCWNGECTADGVCSAACPPDMAAFAPPPPAKPFCVDLTEVTQEAYAAFLATASVGRQRPECIAHNPTFVPHQSSPPDKGQECTPNSYRPDETPKMPVVCVDWCDADAYCRERGRSLCGSITSLGGELTLGAEHDVSTDQWYFACVEGKQERQYVYGDFYEPETCNARDAFPSAPHAVDVGSFPSCRSGPGRPLDLNGNVFEMINLCRSLGTPGAPRACRFRGGAFDSKKEFSRCKGALGVASNEGFPYLGFRCCGG